MRFKYWKILIGAIILLIIFVPTGYVKETISISTGPDSNIGVQMGVPVIIEAYSRLGIDVKIQHYPWPRSLFTSNSGTTDAELFRSTVDHGKYPNLIKVKVPIGSVDFVAFTKDIQLKITGWDSIRPYRLGIIRGVKTVEKYTKGMQIQDVTTYEQAFQILILGRCDLVISSRPTSLIVLKKMGSTDIKELEPPLAKIPIYHYLHASKADLIPRLEKIFKDMADNGEIAAIQEQLLQKILESIKK